MNTLPATDALVLEVTVRAHIVNTALDGDDSCPEDDRCFGHEIGYRRPGGWKSLYYAPADQVQAWLTEHRYQQVSHCGLYPIDGRYRRREREEEERHVNDTRAE